MFHYACRICCSEYREEIEELVSQRVRFRGVARKYQKAFDIDLHLLEQSIGTHYKKHRPKELTKEEKEFLERVRKDELSTVEIQRFVAAKALGNMLMNPHRLKLNDVFRMQNLLLRKEKIQQKRLGQWNNYR